MCYNASYSRSIQINIFATNADPRIAAQEHCDAHILKMCIEYSQMLSSAHRLLDGVLTPSISFKGTARVQTLYLLPGETVSVGTRISKTGNPFTKLFIDNPVCYGITHVNHPCTVWARETSENYLWLYSLFLEVSKEYTHRYGKIHKSQSTLQEFLSNPPKNIKQGPLTKCVQTMPDEYKDEDPCKAYQNFYVGSKSRFAKWTNRPAPSWFKLNYGNYDAANFEKTSSVGNRTS